MAGEYQMKHSDVDRMGRGIALISSVLDIGEVAVLDLLAPEILAEDYDCILAWMTEEQ